MKIYHFIAVIIVSVFTGCQQSREEPQHPNILFISIDDLRPDLGVYGNEDIITPNIDKFASEGVTFLRTYSQAAVCAPSRASLMTGLRPDSTRVWHLGDKFRQINPATVTMPQYFHKYGYHTVSIGKIFHNYMPDSISWDEPDLRPPQYSAPEMWFRDGETFYISDSISELQAIRREEIIAQRPNAYADGWNTGPAWEMADVHDTAYYDGAQTELAIRTLKRLKDKKQPFYLGMGYFRPHLPFTAPKKYWDLYTEDSIKLATNPFVPENTEVYTMNSMYELRHYDHFNHIGHPTSDYTIPDDTARILKQGYYASVSYVDAQVGRLLASLEELGLSENTIVVIWGDHGWKLGEHNSWGKMTNYDIDTHVPLIIKAPGVGQKGIKTQRLTELVDIFPTLTELAGVEVAGYFQGTSLKPLMENPDREWKPAVFSQFHRRPKVTPDGGRYMGYSITTDRYHLVEWRTWDNVKGEAGDIVDYELYDLQEDSDENVNIFDQADESLKEKLTKQLHKGWRAAVPPI
ncbi:MAG: sulfatase [Bacteroidota bacterium]